MIILGIENCPGCKKLRDRHPDLVYIEIPASSGGDRDVIELKKKVQDLRIDRFPSLVNDDITEVFPVSLIDKDF
jgi:hypothetical protein